MNAPRPYAYSVADPAIYNADVDRLLEESRRIWASVAEAHGLRYYLGKNDEHLPALSGRVSGVAIDLVATGRRDLGFVTESRALARLPMKGRVRIRPASDLDQMLKPLVGKTLDDPLLDHVLSMRGSSTSLVAAVVDERTREVLHRLLSRGLRHFVYDNGTIAIAWAGVERERECLAAVLELTAHLAVTGSEVSAYR